MAEPENRLAQLEAKVTELAEQNDRLMSLMRGESERPEPPEDRVQPSGEDGSAAVDRRMAMRRLGTAAAAAVGLVAANGAFRPAGAADGDNVVVGGDYSGTSTSFNYGGGSGSDAIGALQGNNSDGAGIYGSTLTGAGLRGFASGSGGIAVKGRTTSESATPMLGELDNASGAGGVAVKGSTNTELGTALFGEVANSQAGGIGVLGDATGSSSKRGYGVRGDSLSPIGGGAGVLGSNGAGGIGVFGVSAQSGGIGVYAEGGDSLEAPGTGLLAVSPYGTPLRLSGAAIAVPPTSGSWTAGSFLVKDGALWYCIAGGAGSASEWVRLSGAFVPLDSPARAYDSRDADGKLAKGETRDVDVAAALAEIPASASAVLLNATVANTVSSGFLTLYPQGAPVPSTASVNYTAAGQIVGNNATVGLNGGQLTARVDGGPSGNSIDFILDAYGYYA